MTSVTVLWQTASTYRYSRLSKRTLHAEFGYRLINVRHQSTHIPPIAIVPRIDTTEVSDVDISVLGHGYFAEVRICYTQIWKASHLPDLGFYQFKQ
jgi:hypothetical protein